MRVGEKIWHSSRIEIDNAEIPKYEKSTEIVTRFNYLTCMPKTTMGDIVIMQQGETIYNYWTIIANARYFEGKIKQGDLMWVDGEKPIDSVEQEYGYGASANAIVKSVLPVNHSIHISLEQNQNQVKQ